MATQRQITKVRELEAEGFVVIGRRVIGISGRQIFEMERNSSVIQVTANDVIEAFSTDPTDVHPIGRVHRYISVDRCVLVTPKKPQITHGPQKRGKKGKVRRW